MALWFGLIAKPQRTPLSSRPSLTLYFLLAGAFLLTLVPHVLQFPAWITTVVVAAMILRSIIELYRLPLPSTTFCSIVAIILSGLVWIQFGTIMGREAGTALTAGLLAIKFYEIRQPRDIALIIFCCFFVVMSALLFSQVLELFIYCLIMMWVLTALLLRVHSGDMAADRLLRMLEKSGLVFLQALPLALLLFFFFPRMKGPLGLPLNETPIGLTDHVAPGSVAKLSQDESPAMYVHFITAGSVPLPSSMYWRALVLYTYKNGEFTGSIDAGPAPSPPRGLDSERVEQMITILANNQRWLYALDVPISKPVTESDQSWGGLYRDGTIGLSANSKLEHFARYTVASSYFRQEERLNDLELHASLQKPDKESEGLISPAVMQLADRLHQGIADDDIDTYVAAVNRYFHQQDFIYSSDLPPQDKDWLEQFLLRRKTGYCEHFATAFAILMRLKNVHARLVAGYLGGDYNPYNDSYTVRQSHAHVWDEVWKPEKADSHLGRWIRIDPTAMAANAEAAVQQGSANPNDSEIRVEPRAPSLADSLFPGWLKKGMREIRLRREQMETSWDSVVLSYDNDAQFRLAQVLGLGENPKVKLLMLCLVAAAICALALWRWLTRSPAVPPVDYLYTVFCRNMARRGVPRAEWEGPLAYTGRVAEAFPDDEPAIRDFGSIVARARYGPVPADSDTTRKLESVLGSISTSQATAILREKN